MTTLPYAIYEHGICAQQPSDIFTSELADEIAVAVNICKRCPVLDLCDKTVKASPGEYAWGVYGGVYYGANGKQDDTWMPKSWNVRMNADTVRAARALAAAGLSYYEIGKRLGIHQTTIRSAVLRVTWAHIDDEVAA